MISLCKIPQATEVPSPSQTSNMRFTLAMTFLASSALVSATLDPAHSNTQGMCPESYGCAPTKVSQAIQAAECAYNTRTHEKQTFAVFVRDDRYNTSHGAPYGTCLAYTCDAPSLTQLVKNDSCWTFYWDNNGKDSGVGTGCIRDSNTGECGCERSSDGKFLVGRDDCT